VQVPEVSLQAVAFSEDQQLLAVGGADGSVRVWNVAEIVSGNRYHPAVGR
jgi:WD40 repeat protein